MAEKDVEQSSEFIGTVKSRRSVTVQPQVEGFVTRILAASGDRVRAGAVLMEIDAGRQEAAVATLEAQRARATPTSPTGVRSRRASRPCSTPVP